MTRSGGRPDGWLQPSLNAGGAAVNGMSPSGAPPSTQATRVLTCSGASRRSLRNVPYRPSARQGGISPLKTLSLMARAQGRTSLNDIRLIGATWLGRWQVTQLLNTIGATSWLKVGAAPVVPCAGTLMRAGIATARTVAAKTNRATLILER